MQAGTLEIGAGGSLASTSITVYGPNVPASESAATLQVDPANSPLAAGTLASGTNLTAYGNVNFNNATQTIATLNGTDTGGQINLNNNNVLTISGGGSFSGNIGGSGTLIVSGSTFTALGSVNPVGLTVNSGATFNLGTGSSGPTISNVNLTVNGTANLNNGASANNSINNLNGTTSAAKVDLKGTNLTINNGGSYAGAIADSVGGGSVSLNNGTEVLSGTSTYTGATSVNGGILAVNGALSASSAVTVNNGILAGTGTVGAVTLSGGGTINPGSAGPVTIGTLTLTNLNMNSGGILGFDLGASTNDLIKTTTATFGSGNAGQIELNVTGASLATTYTVLTASGTNNLAAGTVPTLATTAYDRDTFAIDQPKLASGIIQIDVTIGATQSLIWNDSLSTLSPDGRTWQNHANNPSSTSDQNWESTGPAANYYYDGDNVTFNDNNNSGGNSNAYNVNINGTVLPGSVTVNTANAYTISSGTIAGSTGLTVSGGGALHLSSTGTYTGATAVQNGTLQLDGGNSLPTGANVILGDGGTNSGILDINGNAVTLATLTTSGTGSGNIVGTSGGGATVTYAGGVTANVFGGTIRDGLPTGGSGQLSLLVSSGTLVLSGSNSYSGQTTINTGTTLQIGNGAATGNLTGNTNITDNGSMVFDVATPGTVTINGSINGTGSITQTGTGTTVLTQNNNYNTTTINAGTLQVGNGSSSGTLGTATSTITDNGMLTFDNTSQITLTNILNGTGGLTQMGAAGTLTIMGVNTYSGPTIVAAGSTLQIGNGTSATPQPGNATLATGASAITVNGALVLEFNATPATGWNNTITGAGPITLMDNGANNFSVKLDGNNTGYTGALTATTVGAFGTRVQIDNVISIPGGGSITINPSSGLFIDPGTAGGVYTGSLTIGGAGWINDPAGGTYGAIRDSGDIAGFSGPITLTANTEIVTSATTTAVAVFSGNIIESSPNSGFVLTKAGTTTMEVSGNNSWSGGTIIANGTLQLGSNTGLPAASVLTFGSTANLAGNGTTTGTLDMNGYTASASSLSVVAGTAATSNVIGNSSTSPSVLTFAGTGASSVYPGLIVDKLGTGTSTVGLNVTSGNLTLQAANTYSGDTVITGGVLQLGIAGAIQNSTANVQVDNGLVFDSGITTFTAGGLAGTNLVQLNDASNLAVTFQVGNNGHNTTFSGTLAGGGSLVKIGTGSLTLSGNSNSYSGGTTISAGTLVAANTSGSATAGGNVTMNGGTLASGLVGSVSGNVLAGTGPHTIAPGGVGTIGSLSIGGLTSSGTVTNLTTLNFDLGPGPATNIGGNQIITNGDLLTLGGGTISVATGTAMSFGLNATNPGDYRLIGGSIGSITNPNSVFALPSVGGTGYSLSTSIDPGFIDLVVISTGPASLTWDDAGGTGDGIHWDTANQNWNNGSAPALYSDGALVTFNDANNFGNGVGQNSTAYNVTLNAMVQPGSVTVNNSSGNYTISGTGAINGSTGLTKTGTSSLTLATANGYTGPTAINQGTLSLTPSGSIASSPITIGTSGVGATAGALSLAAGSSGFLVRNLASLNIVNGSATVATAATTATRSVVVTSALTISANGKLDLSNNDMVVHNGSQSGITSLIASGYHGGPWNGASGITSSTAAAGSNTALGVELNSNGSGGTLIGTFDGQTVTSTDVLVKYTYFGDANLDGVVNGSDYTLIDNGFNNNLTGWHNGDFNYDGIVNGDDYTLIDNAFNTQGASLAGLDAAPSEMVAINTSQIDGGSSGGTAVPEPTSLGLLAIGAVGLLGRRRRRH